MPRPLYFWARAQPDKESLSQPGKRWHHSPLTWPVKRLSATIVWVQIPQGLPRRVSDGTKVPRPALQNEYFASGIMPAALLSLLSGAFFIPMGKAFEFACTVPWMMPELSLQALLSIAAREPLDANVIAERMHGPTSLATRDGKPLDGTRAVEHKDDGIARISINGPIFRYADFFTDFSGGCTTDAIAKDFNAALNLPGINSILFLIDSPGGEATGINELADLIYNARGQKPIVAYVEGYGASAAYWIASAADEVIVDDSALLGSIGTVMAVADPTKTNSRTIEFVSSQSPNKRPDVMTERGRNSIQGIVDAMTEVFIAKVARNRGVTTDVVRSDFGQGGLFVGQQAVDAKLADRIGSEEGTVRELVQRVAATSTSRFAPRRMSAASDIDRFSARLRSTLR